MNWRSTIIVSMLVFFSFQGLTKNPIGSELRAVDLTEPPETPTTVKIGVQLVEIPEIESPSKESPIMKAIFRLMIQWHDPRLHFSPRKNQDVAEFQNEAAGKKLDQIFDPRVKIVDGESRDMFRHLRIFPNGRVTLTHVVEITVPANMKLAHFPFDNQTFTFNFASFWDEHSVDLSLDLLETGLLENAAPTAWHFDATSHHIAKESIQSHAEVFYVLSYILYAERNPRYFLWRLIIPLLVIVVLSWNVFWMFEDSFEALANCIVLLLTVVAFHQIANSMLPVIPLLTFIDSIVFVSYGFIMIPTFEVIVTDRLERRGRVEDAKKLRKLCQWGVPVIFVLTMVAITLVYFA